MGQTSPFSSGGEVESVSNADQAQSDDHHQSPSFNTRQRLVLSCASTSGGHLRVQGCSMFCFSGNGARTR